MMTVNVTRARVTGTLVDIPHEQELVRESGARPVAGDAPAEAAP
jgi:hypothetical protein